MANIDEFTRLPAPPTAPPAVGSGEVVLYRDAAWSSQSMVLRLASYVKGVRHSIGGSRLQDATTWVAFNLPVGTVMTLMEHFKPVEEGKQLWDLRNCGRCIDLVGTGKTQGVSLPECNMNDCVSAFFWRIVDLDLGAVELFQDSGFRGNRNTIFLGDWPSATVNSIDKWFLQDRVSSVRWKTLHGRQKVSLFQNSDGSGTSYQNIAGWGRSSEIARLDQVSFNDRMSSFCWDGLVPMKEVIAPFEFTPDVAASTSFYLASTMSGTNDTDLQQPVTITLKDTTTQTVTVTVSDKYASEFTVSYSTSKLASWLTGTVTFTLKASYEHTTTKTNTTTKTEELDLQATVNAPPRSNYEATLQVEMARVEGAAYQTTAERWYDQPVTGAVRDPANGWYKRVEPVTGTVDGALACRTQTKIQAFPIAKTRHLQAATAGG